MVEGSKESYNVHPPMFDSGVDDDHSNEHATTLPSATTHPEHISPSLPLEQTGQAIIPLLW
jgi:hypothetical protein